MNELFKTIVQSTFYASVIGVFILLIKVVFKNKLTPKWIYLIWMLLIIKLIFPFGPQSNFSIFNKIETKNIIYNGVAINESNINKQIHKIENTDTGKNINTNIEGIKRNNNPITPIETTSINYKFNLSYIWLIVCLGFIILFSFSYILLIKNLKKNQIVLDSRLENLFFKSKQKMNIKSSIRLILSDTIRSPAIMGVFKPTIVIPLSIIDSDDKDLEYIFLHELSHFKRKDNVMNCVLIVLQSIHWFNPFIWYLFKQMREDIELATDEKVLSCLERNEYNDYGITLLNVVSKINRLGFYPNIISMADNKKGVEKRIMNIKFMKNKKKNGIVITLVGVLILVVASPLFLTSAKSSAKSSENKVLKSNDKLSEIQQIYFDIIGKKKSNEFMTKSDVENILKLLNITPEEDNKSKGEEIFKQESKYLTLRYEPKTQKLSSLNYKDTKENDEFDLYVSHLKNNPEIDEDKSFGVLLDNISLNTLEKISNSINYNGADKKLYDTYISIVKDVQKNPSLTKDDIMNKYKDFKNSSKRIILEGNGKLIVYYGLDGRILFLQLFSNNNSDTPLFDSSTSNNKPGPGYNNSIVINLNDIINQKDLFTKIISN
ncbi:M56 family metallopeptidase [[Clostridium] dakarense]|uniref:M56 family metallopeptidase n=1 Tax=Faecalimicrobium dakarense TaxID=1301100 RepID=UPI0004BC4DF8|nr:M56 family metallopeptidase [[Clostridium] dakarense]